MRTAPATFLNPEQRTTLERLARQRSLPARVVERARIVLLAAEGLEDRQIAARMDMQLGGGNGMGEGEEEREHGEEFEEAHRGTYSTKPGIIRWVFHLLTFGM